MIEVDPQAAGIGARIRRLRKARSLTLVQLAALADLSHPFLSQLERGRARPSIGSLQKIAHALGSSQLELLADTAEPGATSAPVSVVRHDEGARGPYGDGNARMLVTGDRRLHPMDIRGENREHGEYFQHAEDEFVHVVEGVIELDLGERGVHRVGPGDSVYYVGGTDHRWRLLDGDHYRLLVVKERPARL